MSKSSGSAASITILKLLAEKDEFLMVRQRRGNLSPLERVNITPLLP
jgi:hypothetical protein